jgi:hypothetical protein
MPRMRREYIQPIDSTGAAVTGEAPHGVYALTANTLYYYILATTDAPFQSCTFTSLSAGMLITTATIHDTDHPVQDVTDFEASSVGHWVPNNPSSGFVGVSGTGWSATNSVVTSTGSAVGGARWNLGEQGAYRTRLAVQVGAVGGNARFSRHGR